MSLGNRTSRVGMVSALATAVVAVFAAAAPASAAEPLTDAVRSVDAAAAAIGAGRGDSTTSDFRKASGAVKASTSLGDVTVAAGTIALGDLRAQIGLPVARTAPASSVVAGDLVVADKATTFVVDALPHGVRISSVLSSKKASHTLRYELTLPDGVGPRLEADGSVSLVQQRAGSPELALASIAAPWAVDAAGHSVATRYEVDGTRSSRSSRLAPVPSTRSSPTLRYRAAWSAVGTRRSVSSTTGKRQSTPTASPLARLPRAPWPLSCARAWASTRRSAGPRSFRSSARSPATPYAPTPKAAACNSGSASHH